MKQSHLGLPNMRGAWFWLTSWALHPKLKTIGSIRLSRVIAMSIISYVGSPNTLYKPSATPEFFFSPDAKITHKITVKS